MSTTLYFFSATGNSLAVARDLAQELGDSRIEAITRALVSGAADASDAVGIVFPVYMFGLPLIVTRFLAALKVRPGAYLFTVATCGGLPGKAHSQAKKILGRRGLELSSGFSVLMPGNYTPLYGAIPKEKQEKMFAAEKLKVREIARLVRGRGRGPFEEKPFLPNALLHKLLYAGGSRQIPGSARNFIVTKECSGCGECARVCPVANIQLHEGVPVFRGHCEHCMACLQWCPAEAIQYKRSTRGRKRYRHPSITAKDIASQR